jgi:hypothetical protein
MAIFLRSSDVQITAEIQSTETFTSRSTGVELKKLMVFFQTTSDDATALVQRIINESRTVESLGAEGEVAAIWKPRQNSESYTDGSPVHRYRWELIQEEKVNIQSLQLDGLTIIPYTYKEIFDEQDRMIIDARARLTPDEVRSLRGLPHYFPVVRKGISDKPQEMRFGRQLWSDHGEYVKQDIYLVGREQDKEKLGGLLQPEMFLWESGIAESSGLLDGLIDFLKTKGVLDDETIQQLRKRAADGMGDRREQFRRVNDLDEWA